MAAAQTSGMWTWSRRPALVTVQLWGKQSRTQDLTGFKPDVQGWTGASYTQSRMIVGMNKGHSRRGGHSREGGGAQQEGGATEHDNTRTTAGTKDETREAKL